MKHLFLPRFFGAPHLVPMLTAALSSAATRLLSPTPPIPRPHRRRPSLLLPSSPISFQRLRSRRPPPPPAAPSSSAAAAAVDPSLLPQRLREIIALFQSVPDPKAKYQQLLYYSRNLPPLDPRYKTDRHRVRGCVSQVWLRAFPDPDNPDAVLFQADSDSALTKGLAALLVLGLSGSPAAVISQVPPDFVHLLGLNQSLTPSRNNGFLNMLRLMQQLALQVSAGTTVDLESTPLPSPTPTPSVSEDVVEVESTPLPAATPSVSDGVVGEVEVEEEEVVEEAVATGGGRAERMRERLERELAPVELVIEDISHQHAGHAGVRGRTGGETHYNLRVVSEKFEGKSLVKRHRLVYGALQEELESGLHALSIDAKTPSEVQSS